MLGWLAARGRWQWAPSHHTRPVAVWGHPDAHDHDQVTFERLGNVTEFSRKLHRGLALVDGGWPDDHHDAVIVAAYGIRQSSARRADRVVHISIRWSILDEARRGDERADRLPNGRADARSFRAPSGGCSSRRARTLMRRSSSGFAIQKFVGNRAGGAGRKRFDAGEEPEVGLRVTNVVSIQDDGQSTTFPFRIHSELFSRMPSNLTSEYISRAHTRL